MAKQFYTPGEVGQILSVDPKTVTRWCNDGKIENIATPGGHRRIPVHAVQAILDGRHRRGNTP